MIKDNEIKSENNSNPTLALNKTVAHQSLEFNSHISTPVTYKKRFVKVPLLNGDHIACMTGSTFSAPSGEEKKREILDSCYTGYIFDEKKISGLVFAVADGFGGHHDKKQDYNIGEAAKIAVTCATNEIAKYKTPEELTDEILLKIAKIVEYEVNSHGNGESTTLACGRVFQIQPDDFVFVGFNVGDCLIASWDPVKKECKTLLAGINDGYCPAPINGFNKDELQIVRTHLNENTLLMAMSDGAYETFALTTDGKNKRGGDIYKYELDGKMIGNIFASIQPNALTNDFVAALLGKATSTIEENRLKNNEGTYGDDATCIIARISQLSFTKALAAKATLENTLSEAIALSISYSKTKNSEEYDKAKTAFLTADNLYTINENPIGKIQCLCGLGKLKLALYAATYNLPEHTDSDYRQHNIEYAAEVARELQQLNNSELEILENEKEIILDIINYLSNAKNLIKVIPDIKWELPGSKIEYKKLIEKTISKLELLQKEHDPKCYFM